MGAPFFLGRRAVLTSNTDNFDTSLLAGTMDAPFPVDAYGYWLLGSDPDPLRPQGSASLGSRTDGRALALVSSAPTYNTGYVTIPDGVAAGAQNGLSTGLVLPATCTMCAVVKVPELQAPPSISAHNRIVMGTLNGTTTSGAGLYYYAPFHELRLETRNNTKHVHFGLSPYIGEIGTWIFVAMVMRPGYHKLFVGGLGPGKEKAVTYTANARPATFGNNNYVDGAYVYGNDFALGAFWNTMALDAARLKFEYARAKLLCRRRGIMVY